MVDMEKERIRSAHERRVTKCLISKRETFSRDDYKI